MSGTTLTDNKSRWKFKHEAWEEDYNYFLIHDGKIHYGFVGEVYAKSFQEEHCGTGMMRIYSLGDARSMFLDPSQPRSWSGKEETLVNFNWETII